MSAELLREAASLMRERAEGATDGLWTVPDPLVEGGSKDVVGPDYLICERAGHDAEHIASWHPAVALAVADWLHACAEFIESDPGFTWDGEDHALNVARAYLGSAS